MGRLSKPQKVENEKLLEHVRQYKETKDPIAFEEIVKFLNNYLISVTKKFFYVAGSNSDDIYQEALYALATKAIPDYDEAKGSFIWFSKLCIRRHIITILKSANNKKHGPLNGSLSLDASVSADDDDGPSTVGGLISNNDEGVVDKMVRNENFNTLKSLLKERLTGLETEILDLYLRNMSYVDIVALMNKRRRGRRRVDTKTIDNALCRIKKKAFELEAALRKERMRDTDLLEE